MNQTLVKWPTRSRPAIFFATLEQWYQDDSVRFLISLDADDFSMNNPEVRGRLASMPRVSYRVGNSRGKVQAMNDGLAEDDWSGLMILAADDMLPQRPDYAKRIKELFYEKFSDGDGLLHLNDGRTGEVLNTLPIMDRRYFDRFGYCFHPDYLSLFCDNEQMEVARGLGRTSYVDEVVIRHAWTDVTGQDDLHRTNEALYSRDQAVFETRKASGFPLESVRQHVAMLAG